MDKLFGPLKQNMMRSARALGYLRRELIITNNKFPAMLAQGLKAISKEQVKGAFKITGTYPAEIANVDM